MARKSIGKSHRYVVAPVALLAVWAVFAIVNPYFLSLSNALNVTAQFAALAIVALGEMLVIVTRGFDISVGAVAALASVVGALAVNAIGPAGLIAMPAVGLACGAVNGLLVAYGGVQPIITTLGMLIFVRGLALWLSGGEQALVLAANDDILSFAYETIGGVPVPLILVVLLTLAVTWLVRRVRLGRRLYMVGSNPQSAALVGVPVRSTVAAGYALCGLGAGLAGALYLSRASAGLPTEANGLELQAIAGAVIGGTALTGGSGNPFLVVVGALFIQSLFNGLNMSGVSPFVANLVMGAVIVVAGALDFALRRLGATQRVTGGTT